MSRYNKITFDEPTHVYLDDSGNRLLSISQLLSLYKNPFDPYGHIARAVAKKRGISVDEILNEWELNRDRSTAQGTKFHLSAEHFINTGQILDNEFKDLVEKLAGLNLQGKLESEIRLSSLEYKLGGTADLLQTVGDKAFLWDFKSNRELHFENKYKKFMFSPLGHIPDINTYHYYLQLNLYKMMIEEDGVKIDEMNILHIDQINRNIIKYSVPEMDQEVNDLLNHYKETQEKEKKRAEDKARRADDEDWPDLEYNKFLNCYMPKAGDKTGDRDGELDPFDF